MKGRTIGVAGMGRSGIAISEAAHKRGARVRVYDEKSAETPERLDQVDRLESQGIEVFVGWHGHLAGEPIDMLVASPGFRRSHPAIRDALAMGCEVVSEIEFASRIAQAPIVAITGTNGKSTTTVMTYQALRAVNPEAVLCGNISGSNYPELTLTEAADVTSSTGVLVAEISSFQLEWVREFRPRAASVTNVTPDHLDRHPTFEDYFETKMRIFSQMGEGDTAIWLADGPTVTRDHIAQHLGAGATIFAVPDAESGPSITGGNICLGSASVPVSALPVVGKFNLDNALVALGLATHCGQARADQAMLEGLIAMQPLGHRMENLGSKAGVSIVNNSMCTNPGAVIANSQAVESRQILLMGGVLKQLDFAPVGDYLRATNHIPVLFSRHRQELADQMKLDSYAGFELLEEAFAYATSIAQPGDVILLCPGCASAEPYTNFRERGEAFRAMAARWLAS